MPTEYSWIGESKEQNMYKRGSRGEYFFFSAVLRDVFALLLKEYHRKKISFFFFLMS